MSSYAGVSNFKNGLFLDLLVRYTIMLVNGIVFGPHFV